MPAPATGKAHGKPQAAGPRVPFVRAAHKLRQPAFQFTSAALGADVQDFGPFDVPSGGFLRSIILEVTCSGGTAGSGVLKADAPWSILRSIELADVNGQALVYPNTTGYRLYLHNRFGAFRYGGLPDHAPDAALTSVVAGKFFLRIPVEIDATDGYGSLPNLNAAEPYRVRLSIAPKSDVYSTDPTTCPVVTVKAYAEDWSLPGEVDGMGNPQEIQPPDMNTTQYLSTSIHTITSGQNTIRLTRTGNLIRGITCIVRDSSGGRVTANYPDDMTITWDRYQLYKESRSVRRLEMAENGGHYGYALPAGVFHYGYSEDGSCPGNEKRNLWLPTLQPTSITFEGTFGGAGTLEIMTNDVAAHSGR
jgi:hypothetical protein